MLHILVRQEAVREIYPLLDRWRTGPIRPRDRRRRGGLDDDARVPRAAARSGATSESGGQRALVLEPKFGVWLWQLGQRSCEVLEAVVVPVAVDVVEAQGERRVAPLGDAALLARLRLDAGGDQADLMFLRDRAAPSISSSSSGIACGRE